jgi:RNA polymerase sigma-70 factor (ECF subfamily)
MEHSAMGDKELALALQGGDQGAFDEIVRRYQGRVYAVAYRLTGNREDALDVAQESLVKAYRKIDSWQPTGGFLPWLLRLTSNHSIDYLRKRNRRQHERLDEAFVPDTEGAAVEPSMASTEEEVRAHEIDDRVRGALHVLSPSQREVFMLRHYEGLQLSEIAEHLGCTVGSVKVHLFRALKKLRGELEDLYQPN